MSDKPVKVPVFLHPTSVQAADTVAALMGWSHTDVVNLALQTFVQIITGPKGKYMEMRDGGGKVLRTIHFCDEEPTREH